MHLPKITKILTGEKKDSEYCWWTCSAQYLGAFTAACFIVSTLPRGEKPAVRTLLQTNITKLKEWFIIFTLFIGALPTNSQHLPRPTFSWHSVDFCERGPIAVGSQRPRWLRNSHYFQKMCRIPTPFFSASCKSAVHCQRYQRGVGSFFYAALVFTHASPQSDHGRCKTLCRAVFSPLCA